MMKEMYLKCKNKITSNSRLFYICFFIFFSGLIFGSIYITILNNNEKLLIMKKVNSFFLNLNKIEFKDKLELFKDSFFSNMIFLIGIWILGLSVIGIPIILILDFFKAFIIGFSIGSIFACFKLKGILAIILYIFPNVIYLSILTVFLSSYSLNISLHILSNALKKKQLNFSLFMGKYFFILLILILSSIICSLLDGFINPYILKLFTIFIK